VLYFGEKKHVSLYPFLRNHGGCVVITERITACYGVSCSSIPLVAFVYSVVYFRNLHPSNAMDSHCRLSNLKIYLSINLLSF